MLRENPESVSKNQSFDLTTFEFGAARPADRLLNSSAGTASKPGNAPQKQQITVSQQQSSATATPQSVTTKSQSASNNSQIDNSQAGDSQVVSGKGSLQRMEADRAANLTHGLRQRFEAISAFLNDVYTNADRPVFVGKCPIASAVLDRIPKSLLGMKPLDGTWTWITSTDIFISQNGEPLVLDHNLACPVGLHRLAELSEGLPLPNGRIGRWIAHAVAGSNATPTATNTDNSGLAVLDAGTFSPAFRENEFIAQSVGANLIRNRDVVVRPDGLYLIQQGRLAKLDTLIRRIDDDVLDPNCFRPDSLIGVPGLVRLCRSHGVRVMNTPGTGLIGNRAIAALIPDMIRYYLGQKPILQSARTFMCGNPADRDIVLGDLTNFAIRTIDPLHPARPFFGSTASAAEKNDVAARLLKDPRNYVARPLLPREELHVCGGFNLRLFATSGREFSVLSDGIGRPAQPDGGATLAVVSDPTAFAVRLLTSQPK